MRSLYPTSTVHNRKSKEDGVVYCTKCGFPCRTKPLIPKGGDGNTRPADKRAELGSKIGKGVSYTQENITIPGGTKSTWVPSVDAGCPNCGAYTYDLPNNSDGKL